MCNEALDSYGDHLLVCRMKGITARHNAIRDECARVLAEAKIPHDKEVAIQGAARPADILLKGWDRGRDTAVDFTIVSPLRLEDYPLNEERTKRVLSREEARKVTKYKAMCEQAG